MKSAVTIAILVATLLTQGCVSRHGPIVLDRIGPGPNQTVGSDTNGRLIVFSSFDVYPHLNDLPYRRFYSDYRIHSDDGKLLQTVHNQSGSIVGEPREVELPVGNYRIFARANGYGLLNVPVKIAAHHTTRVYLEGAGRPIDNERIAANNAVMLPDGQFAGWRADPTRE